jgi:hypothetical protein
MLILCERGPVCEFLTRFLPLIKSLVVSSSLYNWLQTNFFAIVTTQM